MKKLYKYKIKVILIVLLTLILTGCELDVENMSNQEVSDENYLTVHFIDVGQGDSIFVELPNGQTTLIDGGARASKKDLVSYLKDLGVEKIDYLIATHPHEDHIGGLPEIIRNFEIEKVYMPNRTANTAIFEELLLEIKNKGLEINLAKAGHVLIDEGSLKYEILAPNRENYEKTNDFSIVSKISYGENSFLFTGDAEKTAEEDMLGKGYSLASDVLKVGHHGGRTSTIEHFLKKVNPKYGIISLGKDNSYGHPHKETLEKLQNENVEILKTDELGTIIMISDGENIKILRNNDNVKKLKGDSSKDYYIGNKNTKIYHHFQCNSLPGEKNQIIFKTKEEAERKGFKPHEKCVE